MGSTLGGDDLAVAVDLVLVVDGVAPDDLGGQGAGLGVGYGLTPSMEWRKERTRLRPAFLAPNWNGIC